jgi:hypothetical protein
MVDLDRPQIIIMRLMRIACWITKATDYYNAAHAHCLLDN